MIRRFAPTNDRLRSAVARERQIPGLLAAARQNLKNPPHIRTEITLEQLPGIISFFEKDVPAAFPDATDSSVKSGFASSNATVIAALRDYQSWLKSDLLPRSNGEFALAPRPSPRSFAMTKWLTCHSIVFWKSVRPISARIKPSSNVSASN